MWLHNEFYICEIKYKTCICMHQNKTKTYKNMVFITYRTLRCRSPAKSAFVIFVRLFAFRSLWKEERGGGKTVNNN